MKYKIWLNTDRWFYVDVPKDYTKEDIIDYVNWELYDLGEKATDRIEKIQDEKI